MSNSCSLRWAVGVCAVWKVDLVCCREQKAEAAANMPKNYLPVRRLCQVNLWINIMKTRFRFYFLVVIFYYIPFPCECTPGLLSNWCRCEPKPNMAVTSLGGERLWYGGGGLQLNVYKWNGRRMYENVKGRKRQKREGNNELSEVQEGEVRNKYIKKERENNKNTICERRKTNGICINFLLLIQILWISVFFIF